MLFVVCSVTNAHGQLADIFGNFQFTDVRVNGEPSNTYCIGDEITYTITFNLNNNTDSGMRFSALIEVDTMFAGMINETTASANSMSEIRFNGGFTASREQHVIFVEVTTPDSARERFFGNFVLEEECDDDDGPTFEVVPIGPLCEILNEELVPLVPLTPDLLLEMPGVLQIDSIQVGLTGQFFEFLPEARECVDHLAVEP